MRLPQITACLADIIIARVVTAFVVDDTYSIIVADYCLSMMIAFRCEIDKIYLHTLSSTDDE